MSERDDLRSRVDSGLDTLRAGMAPDGADLQITDWTADRGVEVSLVLTADACEECIVAPELLETVVKGAVQQAAPEVTQVKVSDPRVGRPT